MAYGWKIEGLSQLQKAIDAKRKEIEQVIIKGVGKGADTVKASAKVKAPKDEHNLENAIDKDEVWNKNGKISVHVGISVTGLFNEADGRYAKMQEHGTSKMKAQPYLRPALNENKAQINNEIVSNLKGVIEK